MHKDFQVDINIADSLLYKNTGSQVKLKSSQEIILKSVLVYPRK
jgi:hypothetical protein